MEDSRIEEAIPKKNIWRTLQLQLSEACSECKLRLDCRRNTE